MAQATEGHEPRTPGTTRPTIGLGELMVVIAYIAGALAVARANIGLGITAFALACLTLQVWFGGIAAMKAEGRPMTAGEKAGLLLMATGGVLLFSGLVVLVFFVTGVAGSWLTRTLHAVLGDHLARATYGLIAVAFVIVLIGGRRRSKSVADPDPGADGED